MTKRHHIKELLNAVNKRCLKLVESSVASGGDINIHLTDKGQTALHLAVLQNDLSLTKLVLSLGADISRTTNKKETVLHLAMDSNNPAKAKDKQAPCSMQRNEDLVEFLLSHSLDMDAQNISGQSALHLAVLNSSESYVNLLLKTRIDVNLTMNNGSTALHCAMTDLVDSSKRMSIVRSLVESGAQINIQNKMGETALYLASKRNNIDLANYLISKGADVNCKTRTELTAMFAAIKHCNLKMMRLLIKNGARVNVINNAGDNLLHYALKNVDKGEKRLDLVKLLLKNDLDINAENRKRRTALFIALRVGDEDLLNLLLKHGICPNTADSFHLTPLHVAIKQNSQICMQILLKHGAVANENSAAYPRNAEPLISEAIRLNRTTLIGLLVDQGSDMHKSAMLTRTPLNTSICNGLHKVTNLLLNRGVNINLKDRYGDTALHVTVEKLIFGSAVVSLNLVNKLLSLRADVCAENKRGLTPFTMIFDPLRFDDRKTEPGFTLVRHMALMTVRQQFVGVKNLDAILSRPEYFTIFQLSLREIHLMQKTKIGNSNVFYYDLLTGKGRQLVKYAQNVDVAETMEAQKYRLAYCRYYCMQLLVNYTTGKTRLYLIQQARIKLVELAPVKLPTEIATYICEHLSNKNLLNLEKTKLNESEEVAEEDDYSASACAIIQRRNSSRRHSRRKRRPSSPFSPDAESALRRRSSVFTTSSGDTAISIDEGGEEQILDNLKLHKEVLYGVKQQPWPLRKKLKLVRQAKAYVRKHEGALQERLAQTRSTRDAIARASILLTKKWQYFKRELVNFKTVLVPWERRIKQIESQFGSAVASYFIFLRWLFWINLVISAALVTFVAIPEFLATLQNATIAGERKIMLPEEQVKSTHLLTLWEFEGYLKYSPFFYGWYANQHTYKAYKLPLAYFVVNLVVYTYSFVAILRKMAKNSRMSKLSEKEDECAFSWKLFTGWDFMIGNAETAHNRIGSIVLGLKEALLEESEKHRDERNWKIMSIRIFVNMLVMALLAVSAYAVVEVVERSEDIRAANSSWWRQNEITVVMTLITYSFPILFEVLGIIESYHPRKQLRLQLGRNQATNYTLPIDNTLNTSQDILALHEFDANSILSDWTTEEVIFESNVTLFSDPANFSLPSIDNATEIWDSLDNFTHNGLKVRNYLRDMDENPIEIDENAINPDENTINIDENLINIDDNYPHVNYNDYGFLDVDNKTENFFPGLSTENTIQTTTQKVVSSNKADYPAVSTTANSCGDVDRVIRCYERICTNKTFTSDNFSGNRKYKIYLSFFDNVFTSFMFPIFCLSNLEYEQNLVSMTSLDIKTRRLLRGLCWETMFGQEIAKLTMMDLVLTIFSTMGMDFFRALFVRYMNSCWCWDLEKQFPQYGDFKIAENILHLVNNQGMVWMGIFFSPGLIVLNVIKLVILMYLRSWTVLTCNVPHEIVFKASRVLDYIASPGIVIPLIVLMALIIYYMVSLTNSLRESNNDLKVTIQLRQERTEERRKMFKIAEKRLESHDTQFTRWKKILPATNKSIDLPSIVKLGQADQIAEAAAAIAETAVIQEREQKRSGGSDNGELTEGEQESLPNDQIPETTRKESNDSPKRQKATTSYRKNSWRASRTKESPPESGESSEGAIVLIPRIRISIEEPPSEVATRQTSASSDPTHTRRKSTNSDHHSQ
ncbi:hypothetical protein TSAR_012214 [Trichomalopsis sarcophagae]|uniref:TMC domain-containing protein n=1 Tax=Trichomalopsis sarcophagae TaxID=543379 RepID=A0A232F0B0_9HYME|nr:hypothetical protein TSAR_012214 [Trichomalopsis sarcophagae]